MALREIIGRQLTGASTSRPTPIHHGASRDHWAPAPRPCTQPRSTMALREITGRQRLHPAPNPDPPRRFARSSEASSPAPRIHAPTAIPIHRELRMRLAGAISAAVIDFAGASHQPPRYAAVTRSARPKAAFSRHPSCDRSGIDAPTETGVVSSHDGAIEPAKLNRIRLQGSHATPDISCVRNRQTDTQADTSPNQTFPTNSATDCNRPCLSCET